MLANVLNSQRAVTASIDIVRAFMKMREVFLTRGDMLKKFAEWTGNTFFHVVYTAQFRNLTLTLFWDEITSCKRRRNPIASSIRES